MVEARRMGKSELFSHFADRFEVKRTQAREFFDELTTLSEKELKRAGEFVLPGMSESSQSVVNLLVSAENVQSYRRWSSETSTSQGRSAPFFFVPFLPSTVVLLSSLHSSMFRS